MTRASASATAPVPASPTRAALAHVTTAAAPVGGSLCGSLKSIL